MGVGVGMGVEVNDWVMGEIANADRRRERRCRGMGWRGREKRRVRMRLLPLLQSRPAAGLNDHLVVDPAPARAPKHPRSRPLLRLATRLRRSLPSSPLV